MKYLKLIFVSMFLFSFISCNNTPDEITENDELTKEEYQFLLRKVRSFIKVSQLRNPISDRDKNFIYTHEPKFKAYYYGHKSGRFRMVWSVRPGYSVRIIGKGEFLEDDCLLRLTVSRFAQ